MSSILCIAFIVVLLTHDFATGETKLQQLKALYDSLPTPVAYYPMTKAFSLRDGSGNGLDGSFSANKATSVAGPFGVADTAFETGASFGDAKYMSFRARHFDFKGSSWTMALWVNAKAKVGPIVQYHSVSTWYAHLWIWPTAAKLFVNPSASGWKALGMPCNSRTWQFVAWVYDSSSETMKLFCDDKFAISATRNSNNHPETAYKFLLGYSTAESYSGLMGVDRQFACLQIYEKALSAAQLLTAKSMCSLYEEAINCPLSPVQKCQTDTCRPDLSSPEGYTCSACLPGWSGSDCQTSACDNPCQNGGTCVGPDLCSCSEGWQGASCNIAVCLRACPFGELCTAPGVCSPWGGDHLVAVVYVYGRKGPMSPPIYTRMDKHLWLVFGELTYDEAARACRIQNGELAVFNSLSEDHLVRRRIEWDTLPGHYNGKTWVGQLWLGAKRIHDQQNEWQWNTGASFTFESWVGVPDQAPANQSCLMLRRKGWRPAVCEGGSQFRAGAICQILAEPGSDSQIESLNSKKLVMSVVMRKSYFVIKGNYTWDSAGRGCLTNNGTLAMPKSKVEMDFIKKNLDLSFVGFRAWLGLRRPNQGSSSFIWIDRTPNKFKEGYLLGQPDNPTGGNQDCVALTMNDAGAIGWADFACNPYGTVKGGRSPISALCESSAYL